MTTTTRKTRHCFRKLSGYPLTIRFGPHTFCCSICSTSSKQIQEKESKGSLKHSMSINGSEASVCLGCSFVALISFLEEHVMNEAITNQILGRTIPKSYWFRLLNTPSLGGLGVRSSLIIEFRRIPANSGDTILNSTR